MGKLGPLYGWGTLASSSRVFRQRYGEVLVPALYDAQKGEKAPFAKPFKGVGSGVFEIAVRFDTNAYRAVYAVQIGKQIYMLHAFQKKSKSGTKTPPRDVELITRRYQQAVEMEKENHE